MASAQPVKSRAVSVTMLQEALKSPNAEGVTPRDLLEMCGLTRIEGYTLDRANHDLVIFGQVNPAAPPLHTEDLAVALRAAWLKYAQQEGNTRYYSNPGCSIDPDPGVVRQLSEIGRQIGATEAPDEVEGLLAQWCEVSKQPQRVRVMGVPFDSHFASVMVQADYDLKRLVDGSVPLQTPGVTSLVEMMMAAAQNDLAHGRALRGPASFMSRFWFYPGQGKYCHDGDTVTVLQSPVIQLTEEE